MFVLWDHTLLLKHSFQLILLTMIFSCLTLGLWPRRTIASKIRLQGLFLLFVGQKLSFVSGWFFYFVFPENCMSVFLFTNNPSFTWNKWLKYVENLHFSIETDSPTEAHPNIEILPDSEIFLLINLINFESVTLIESHQHSWPLTNFKFRMWTN